MNAIIEINNNVKDWYLLQNVGRAKYVINYHLEGRTYKDNSPFYDIVIFRNKKDLNKFINQLNKNLK